MNKLINDRDNQKKRLLVAMSSTLLALAFCIQVPLAVQANELGGLKPEIATLASTQSSNVTTSSSASMSTLTSQTPASTAVSTAVQATTAATPTTTMLYGTAKKHEAISIPDSANADPKLQAEKAAADAYQLAVQKLSHGQELSADDYRSLGIGIAGFEANQTYFNKTGEVIEVYEDSPADKAGLKVGDKLAYGEENPTILAQEKKDPTVPTWQVEFGRVGEPVDVTVIRHHKPVTLTLIKMNMEDIKEPRFRHQREKIVRELGYPKGGTFTGTDLHNLTETK